MDSISLLVNEHWRTEEHVASAVQSTNYIQTTYSNQPLPSIIYGWTEPIIKNSNPLIILKLNGCINILFCSLQKRHRYSKYLQFILYKKHDITRACHYTITTLSIHSYIMNGIVQHYSVFISNLLTIYLIKCCLLSVFGFNSKY